MDSFAYLDNPNRSTNTNGGINAALGSFFMEIDQEYTLDEQLRVRKPTEAAEDNLKKLERCIADAVKSEQRLNDMTNNKQTSLVAAPPSAPQPRNRPRCISFGLMEDTDSNNGETDEYPLTSMKASESQYTTYSFSSHRVVEVEDTKKKENETKEEEQKASTAAAAASASPVLQGSPRAPRAPPPLYRRVMQNATVFLPTMPNVPPPQPTTHNGNINDSSNSNVNLNNSNSINNANLAPLNNSRNSNSNSNNNVVPPPRLPEQAHQQMKQTPNRSQRSPPKPETITEAEQQLLSSTRSDNRRDSSQYDFPLAPHYTAYEIVNFKGCATSPGTPKYKESDRQSSCGTTNSHSCIIGSGSKEASRKTVTSPLPPAAARRRSSSSKPKRLDQMTHFLMPVQTAHKDKSSSSLTVNQKKPQSGRRNTYPNAEEDTDIASNAATSGRRAPSSDERLKKERQQQHGKSLSDNAIQSATRSLALETDPVAPRKPQTEPRKPKQQKDARRENIVDGARERKRSKDGQQNRQPRPAKRVLSMGTTERLSACLRPMSYLAQDEENFYTMLTNQANEQKDGDMASPDSVYLVSPTDRRKGGVESDEEDALSFISIGDNNELSACDGNNDLLHPAPPAAAYATMEEKIRHFRYSHRVPQPQPEDGPTQPPVEYARGEYERLFHFSLAQVAHVRSPHERYL